jgi:hypothetical protein
MDRPTIFKLGVDNTCSGLLYWSHKLIKERLEIMNKTLMKEMKKLDNRELNEVMDFARELMVMNGKLEFTPGTKVYVVQKTKKTPGTVRKVLLKNAVVDMDNGRSYRVPMSMLEAA